MTAKRPATRAGLLALAALCGGALILTFSPAPPHPPAAASADPYIRWLEERSMLHQARQAEKGLSGQAAQWQHRYGQPRPQDAVRTASVWLLDYPGSVIVRPGQSVLATWGDPALWQAFAKVGIDLLHTGPINRAGGVVGRRYTPTTDGWFDPISLHLDPAIGTEAEYARMVNAARDANAVIAGDLVPLHTGTGPDFQLALRAYKEYPGLYTMVEVPREHWPLLPPDKGPDHFALLPRPAAERLTRLRLIPGLINSNDADPDARKWSGWSASGAIRGADGQDRRWVYLHYFKPTQPTLNWLDPSFAAWRAIGAATAQAVYHRKARVLRLDAVPFLGIEPRAGTTQTLHYQHPLSVTGTNAVAYLVRKLGGFTFHELNVPLDSLKDFTRQGPDLSYDFFTRAQYLHALLTGDAAPLRLAFRWLLEAGVPPGALFHDLQNHDEITYQLVEPDHRKEKVLQVGGEKLTGQKLKDRLLDQMRERLAGPAAPYNRLYRPEKDGLATTFAGYVAPALGVRDPYNATPEQVRLIQQGHLLLAAANALQPGAFGLSSWDLVGALPVPESSVKERVEGGDYRWINRGGVDLMGASPEAKTSAFGLPRARALYGPLPKQLADPDSFASRLARMLAARRKARIPEGVMLAAPETRAPGLCILILRLPDQSLAVTVLNFARQPADEELDLREWSPGPGDWTDLLTGQPAGAASGGRLRVRPPALSGTTLVLYNKGPK